MNHSLTNVRGRGWNFKRNQEKEGDQGKGSTSSSLSFSRFRLSFNSGRHEAKKKKETGYSFIYTASVIDCNSLSIHDINNRDLLDLRLKNYCCSFQFVENKTESIFFFLYKFEIRTNINL